MNYRNRIPEMTISGFANNNNNNNKKNKKKNNPDRPTLDFFDM
jgi:hypothetical protein